jgi:acyl-coenzyme A thioesterase 13
MRDHLKVLSATAAPKVTATFELKVVRGFCNRIGNMHGGAVSLIFDMCTTMTQAPISRVDFWHFGGVSRTLSVTFLRPTPVGTEVVIECEVIQIGARLGEFAYCRFCGE